jgi:hypothetical protein
MEWVSISEGLPKRYTPVLVRCFFHSPRFPFEVCYYSFNFKNIDGVVLENIQYWSYIDLGDGEYDSVLTKIMREVEISEKQKVISDYIEWMKKNKVVRSDDDYFSIYEGEKGFYIHESMILEEYIKQL